VAAELLARPDLQLPEALEIWARRRETR